MKKIMIRLILFALMSVTAPYSHAIYPTIEVNQATLDAYSLGATTVTPFKSIRFQIPFEPGTTPNVFVMTPEFGVDGVGEIGDDPCNIRIRNVTNLGFEAVCQEPYNENRISSAVTFDYIAIQNGVVTIPTTTMGTSVTFESKCTTLDPDSHQEFQNTNCDHCSLGAGPPAQTQGFKTVSFDTVFPAPPALPPALLVQLKTTANLVTTPFTPPMGDPIAPIGEPEFIAMGARNVTNTNFQATIDRLEAGVQGNEVITEDETFCYLAVEQNGCQTLDLSGIDGSIAAVKFQALQSGQVIRGHDTAFGATFAPGCFTNTPVAVASLSTRRGDDGGITRRSAITTAGITLINDEDRVSNTERGHTTEIASILSFGSAFTTPVTLSNVQISEIGKRLKFNWETASESFHLGFHLWGKTLDGWVQLNSVLIPGNGTNVDSATRYRKRIRLSNEYRDTITRFGISSIDTSGFEEFYGPFEIGQEYGEGDTSEPIDWADTRLQFERSMRAKGYTKVRGRWKKINKRKQRRLNQREHRRTARGLDVQFQGEGMRKITGADILEAQPQWQNLDLKSLAVTLNGNAVERRIVSHDSYLSIDDIILLNVVVPQGRDGLYLDEYTYRLQRNRSKVSEAQHSSIQYDDSRPFVSVVATEQHLTQDKRYLAAITSGSPWYDEQLFTTSGPVSTQYSASFSHEIELDLPGTLNIDLFGSIDLPGDQPDHHVQVSVNGHVVVNEWFDGLTHFKSQVALAPGILKQENNQVRVILPGDTGLVADLVLVDQLSLLAPTKLNLLSAIDFASNDEAPGYTVQLDESRMDKTVFAYSSKGGFSTLDATETDAGIMFPAIPFVSSTHNSAVLRYAVVDVESLPNAESIEHTDIGAWSDMPNPQSAADLMIVAHPNFIGEDLQGYIEFKRDLGLDVQLLDWFDVVVRFGFGNNTPQSLDNYLASLDSQVQPKHILLVGGHTYDYKDLLGQGAVNFIPAHYRKVSIFEYTQSDNVYADLDDDNLPEIAIGRWPVRTGDDLKAIITKSIRWQEMHGSDSVSNDVLLIAQPNDGRNLDFEASLDGRVSSNLNRPSSIANIERVYLGQLSSDSPVTEAREMISEAINTGTRLVSFAGHASNAAWGFQGIVNTGLIQSLTNESSPTIVMPLACYTTDYQSLHTNTLAHQWLFAGNQGAAAVHGATSLGQYRENGIFAERMLKESAAQVSLGRAILRAKQKMAPVNETLHNWALLGDPTLPAP